MATNVPVTGDTAITIKISVNDSLKKLKLPLKDLNGEVLLVKLRQLLAIPLDKPVTFERFSDSAGGYVTLDASNPAAFKTLVRAAKAKLKLRLKATVEMDESPEELHKIQQLAAQLPEVPNDPIVARLPASASARTSTALDRRSVGPGIFEYKEARASQPPKAATNEAPVPKPFSVTKLPAKNLFKDFVEEQERQAALAFRPKPADGSVKATPTWSVYCNECDKVMENEHFHCSICEGGDFDLCVACVERGVLCPGEGHWLVKRLVKDGEVVSSTTVRLPPKPKSEEARIEKPVKTETGKNIPGAFTDDVKAMAERLSEVDSLVPSRTCNCCVNVQTEDQFVTCNACADYDLCLKCHAENKHGHHPAHGFRPATQQTKLNLLHHSLLPAGRNARHHAICDECNTNIYGVRHKCFNCPDYDLCNDCVKQARTTHPHHRFGPIYEPIAMSGPPRVKHHGVYCDGPACTNNATQDYIEGVRYKCVVCHDTDFCADCEASPKSLHNPTHPLVKIKTPIKGLNISTVNEGADGRSRAVLGDKKREALVKPATSEAAKSVAPTSNSMLSVKTVADIKPYPAELPKTAITANSAGTPNLNATFVHDTVRDGTVMKPETRFTQVWTMRNPGPETWPAGCSVRFVGGDNMLNIDNSSIPSAASVAEATESNVIGCEVMPGRSVAFKVVMKSPTRLGKAISYWRLKTANGMAFGHRLWCDVDIKAAEAVQAELAASSPSTAAPLDLRKPTPALPAWAKDGQASSVPWSTYYTQYQERMKTMQAQRAEMARLQREIVSLNFRNRPQPQAPELATMSNPWRQQMEDFVKRSTSSPMLIPATPEQLTATESPKTEAAKVGSAAIKDSSMEDSQMVFPTLEKESPANSTYQPTESSQTSKGKAAYVEDDVEETGSKSADIAKTSPTSEVATSPSEPGNMSAGHDGFEDVADEIEVLSADGDMSEDDGFLTDEEYDILEASDQETVVSSK